VAASFIRARIAKGTTVHVDESGAWDSLHERFEMKRVNHQEAYSQAGACGIKKGRISATLAGANLYGMKCPARQEPSVLFSTGKRIPDKYGVPILEPEYQGSAS
jgi:hypothetical protein